MRSFAVGLTVALVASLLCAGNCSTPQQPVGPGEGEGESASACDVDDVTIPRPLGEDGSPIAAVLPGGGAIDFACVAAPAALTQAPAVRVQGCIDVFGIGARAARGIRVAVFADDQNPSTDVPAFGEVEIALDSDAAGLDCGGADANNPACLSLSCERRGAYALDGVPVHVPLTMKVFKPGDDTVVDTYSYGIVLDHQNNVAVDSAGEACGGAANCTVTYAANLIYSSTWQSIPILAGRLIDGGSFLGDGEGRAVIAGEVRDCNDNVVQGATVTSDLIDAVTKVTYFDGSANDPKPKLAALSTNVDGRYVVLNASTDSGSDVHTITAGILEPGCAGDTCSCVSLGSRTIRTFPDSVSIVTLRGAIPTVQ